MLSNVTNALMLFLFLTSSSYFVFLSFLPQYFQYFLLSLPPTAMHSLSSILMLLMELQVVPSLDYEPTTCSYKDPEEYSFHRFVVVSILTSLAPWWVSHTAVTSSPAVPPFTWWPWDLQIVSWVDPWSSAVCQSTSSDCPLPHLSPEFFSELYPAPLYAYTAFLAWSCQYFFQNHHVMPSCAS